MMLGLARIGLFRASAGGQRTQLAGHALVGVEDVEGQPAGDEAIQQGHHPLDVIRMTHFLHPGDEIRMALAMTTQMAEVDACAFHQRFFGAEVMGRVASQPVEHMGQLRRPDDGAAGRPLRQCIDQVHQLTVLAVHLAETGLEIVRPLERSNTRRAAHQDAPGAPARPP